ncbi:hypothetical protein GMLC_36180 [Geomonas limicola]|uniref:DinB-like domain-containing protein n=2 Tax=Geomonas limicola TaxID=2740186 RepID=A0A6V8NGF5_9BACT|nr:hypothetical protein GMLC_36180 [Geomonas limicola]
MDDIKELLTGLGLTPKLLTALVQGIPAERLDLRRGEGSWTIAEHVSHLAEVQPMLLGRLHRLATEDHPVFVPFLPTDEPSTPFRQDMTVALEQFATYRTRQLELLEQLDQAVFAKAGSHPEYDSYTLYILTRHILMHDHWHMYRIEELWLTKDQYLTALS